MSKNLYFGGSFDPVHLGHLICARAAAEIIGCDQVVLIPTAISPLKPRQDGVASATDRVKMLQLACSELPDMGATTAKCQPAPAAIDVRFAVDDLEIHRPGPSYTIDTVRQLVKQGEKRPCWLIGADGIATLPKWHEAEKLMAEAELVAITERLAECRDPTDDKFLELAVNGQADLIMTGDKDLLVLNPFRGIPIVAPVIFVQGATR